MEEDLNTETSLRELVNDLKYSGDEEIDKPIENLKHYLSNIIKENLNNNKEGEDTVFEEKTPQDAEDTQATPQQTSDSHRVRKKHSFN